MCVVPLKPGSNEEERQQEAACLQTCASDEIKLRDILNVHHAKGNTVAPLRYNETQ